MTVAALLAFLQTQPPERMVLTAIEWGNYWDEQTRFQDAMPSEVLVYLASDGHYDEADPTLSNGTIALVL
jgi:hypothetical protein